MWWGIYVQFRGERMQDIVSERSRYLGAFDGDAHGDRQAKKLAKQIGKDYIATGSPGQPRLVKSPLEPFNNDLFAAQAAADEYPGDLDVEPDDFDGDDEALFTAVGELWREAYRIGWPAARPSVYGAFNAPLADFSDASAEYLVGLQAAGYHWRRLEMQRLQRPPVAHFDDPDQPDRLTNWCRLRSWDRGAVLGAVADEFRREWVDALDASLAYRELGEHYVVTGLHETHAELLPAGLTGEGARAWVEVGISIFNANWWLEAVEGELPPDHHAFTGVIRSPAWRPEFYPAVAKLIKEAGWALREGEPGGLPSLPDQIMLPDNGILAVDRPGFDAKESVRFRVTEWTRKEGVVVAVDAVGGAHARGLAEHIQSLYGHEEVTVSWQKIIEGTY